MWIKINFKFLYLIILIFCYNLAFSNQVLYIKNHSYYLSHLFIPNQINLNYNIHPEIINYSLNRHNQITGIYQFENTILQEILLTSGQAIFYPDITLNKFWYEKFINAEKLARKNLVGFWKGKFNQYLNPTFSLADKQFLIAEDTISRISLYQNNFYINLNENKFKNLAIVVPKSFLKQKGIKLKNYKFLRGKNIQVRGWVKTLPHNKYYLFPSNHLMVHLEE